MGGGQVVHGRTSDSRMRVGCNGAKGCEDECAGCTGCCMVICVEGSVAVALKVELEVRGAWSSVGVHVWSRADVLMPEPYSEGP